MYTNYKHRISFDRWKATEKFTCTASNRVGMASADFSAMDEEEEEEGGS